MTFAVGAATDMVMWSYAEIINRDNSGPLIKVINITRKSVTMDGISAKLGGCTLLATTQGEVADHLANAGKPKWSSFKPIALLTRTPLLVVARDNLKDANLANIIEQACRIRTRWELAKPAATWSGCCLCLLRMLPAPGFGQDL